MKRLFVDTSAWFAYAKEDDPDHAVFQEILNRWEGRLVTTNFVFDETVTLVRYRAGFTMAQRIALALKSGRTSQLVRVLPEDEDAAWNIFSEYDDKEFSFTDCTSFAVMKRLGIAVAASTDRHFKQAGFQVEPHPIN